MIMKDSGLGGSAKRAYDYILDGILSNRFKAGSPISENDLVNELIISRTPIREALTALERGGLVKRFAKRGCFVAEITTKDIEEIFDLRILLEVRALKTSCKLIPEEKLRDLEKRLTELTPESSPEEYYGTDRDLHGLILSYCGNSRLIDIIGTLNLQIERVRVISSMKPARLQESRKEHLAIIEAMLDQDIALAEEVLTEHITHVMNSTLEVSKYSF